MSLLEQFEAGEIDAHCFDHRHHVQAGFEMLAAYPFMEAANRYCECLQELATRSGAPEKFHLTVTLAFLSLIAERMSVDPTAGFETFIGNNADLLSSSVLARWYTADRLESDAGRRRFLLPEAQRSPVRQDMR